MTGVDVNNHKDEREENKTRQDAGSGSASWSQAMPCEAMRSGERAASNKPTRSWAGLVV